MEGEAESYDFGVGKRLLKNITCANCIFTLSTALRLQATHSPLRNTCFGYIQLSCACSILLFHDHYGTRNLLREPLYLDEQELKTPIP